MATILTLLSGLGSGIIGTFVTKGFEFFQAKQKFEQELQLRKLDIEQTKAEAVAAERQQAIKMESMAASESYRAEATRISKPGDSLIITIVDAVRGLTRPALTIVFVVLAGAIYFTTDSSEIQEAVTNTVLYLATVCVTWWFGTRPPKKN